MEENQKKAFDFAVDLTKQLITLSTVIITFTVTFSKDIIGNVDDSNRQWLFLSWLFFIFSILFGILTFMALTGNLDPIPKKEKKVDGTIGWEKPEPILTITSSNVTSTGKYQILTFLFALLMTCFYGYKASMSRQFNTDKSNNSYMIIRKSHLSSDTLIHIDTLYFPIKK
jgi:hypothetical protein